jgi:hypothetical protein
MHKATRALGSPNHSFERGRPQAALVSSLRGFAVAADPHAYLLMGDLSKVSYV